MDGNNFITNCMMQKDPEKELMTDRSNAASMHTTWFCHDLNSHKAFLSDLSSGLLRVIYTPK